MILLNQNSSTPINEQLLENLKKLIFSGVLEEDSKLPSVRNIAKDLMINPNTVHKVYQELVTLNLVTSVPQKGLFVNKISNDSFNEYKKQLEQKFVSSYKDLEHIGINKQDILKLLD